MLKEGSRDANGFYECSVPRTLSFRDTLTQEQRKQYDAYFSEAREVLRLLTSLHLLALTVPGRRGSGQLQREIETWMNSTPVDTIDELKQWNEDAFEFAAQMEQRIEGMKKGEAHG